MRQKNNYAYINRMMKTHVEMFKQQVRAAKLISEELERSKNAAKSNVVDVLETKTEQLQDPTATS